MSRTDRMPGRSRASLLATSMFATAAVAGLGALGAATLAPGVALAVECSPPPDAGSGGALAVTTNPTELCGPGEVGGQTYADGLAYQANVTSLTVITAGAGTIGPNFGVFIVGNGTGNNLSFLVDTSAGAGPTITTTGGQDGIHL